MPQDNEPAEGSYQYRENKRNERKALDGRNRTVRRALMTAGAGVLALFIAKGAMSGPAPSTSPDNIPMPPAPTETLNPEIYSQLLERYPDAQVHTGGSLTLHINQVRNELFPKVRIEPSVQNKPEPNFLHNAMSYPRINNAEFTFNSEGTDLRIENYVTVLGDNADASDFADQQEWLAITFTGSDGSNALGYVSISNQTAQYLDIEDGGNPTSLDLFTRNQFNDLNKTTVISNK